MQQDKAMKQIITKLAQKHGLDLAAPSGHLRLEMKNFDRLVIEKIAQHRLCVAHYYEHMGVLIADPELEFFIDAAGGWWPIAITQTLVGHRVYAELTPEGEDIARVDTSRQVGLVGFAKYWARNLKDQNWLDRAHCGALVIPNIEQRFPLGRLLTTPGAHQALEQAGQDAFEFFARHQAQDWGEVEEEDQRLNDESVNQRSRLLSAYRLKTGVKVWLISEADRSATTVLLPEEY
jgi:hypothetical protein